MNKFYCKIHWGQLNEDACLTALSEPPTLPMGDQWEHRFQNQSEFGVVTLFWTDSSQRMAQVIRGKEGTAFLWGCPTRVEPETKAESCSPLINPADRSIDQWLCQSGGFACITWNELIGAAHLAIDPVGFHNLYYTRVNDDLICSSHPYFLAKETGHVRLNVEALNLYLALKGIPAPWSPFEGISKVKPGYWITVEKEDLKETEYWSLLERTSTPFSGSLEDAALELDETLGEAVHQAGNQISLPMGVFLSGGLDSTYVMSKIKQNGFPMTAYTSGYVPSSKGDETAYAQRAAAQMEVPLEIQRISAPALQEMLQTIMPTLPEPVADPSFWPQMYLAQLVRSNVILDGTGSDGLLGGSNKYIAESYSKVYLRLPPIIRKRVISPISQLLPASRRWRLTNSVRLWQFFITGCEQPADLREVYWTRFLPFDRIKHLLDKEHSLELDIGGDCLNSAYQSALADASTGAKTRVRAASYMTLKYIQPWVELHKLAAIQVNCPSIINSPFLYTPLIEKCLRLPDQYKVKEGKGKYVLYQAAKGRVPDETFSRRKANFAPPVDRWICHDLRSYFQAAMAVTSLFDRNEVNRLFTQQDTGWRDWQSELWALFMFQHWWTTLNELK